MGVAIDPQASGWQEDGSDAGSLRTHAVSGDLVAYPFRVTQLQTETFGTASRTYQTTGIQTNSDGSSTGVTLSLPVKDGSDTGGLRIWYPFYGRVFGLRWMRPSTATTTLPPTCSVVVDGEAVEVKLDYLDHVELEGVSNIEDAEARCLTHDYLDPGVPHVAEIMFPFSPSGTQLITLHGVLLDRAAGYREPQRVGQIHNVIVQAVATSDTAIPSASASATALHAFTQIHLFNDAASASTVTFKVGANVFKRVYLEADGTKGDSDTVDFGEFGVGVLTSMTWIASQAGVNALVLGVR